MGFLSLLIPTTTPFSLPTLLSSARHSLPHVSRFLCSVMACLVRVQLLTRNAFTSFVQALVWARSLSVSFTARVKRDEKTHGAVMKQFINPFSLVSFSLFLVALFLFLAAVSCSSLLLFVRSSLFSCSHRVFESVSLSSSLGSLGWLSFFHFSVCLDRLGTHQLHVQDRTQHSAQPAPPSHPPPHPTVTVIDFFGTPLLLHLYLYTEMNSAWKDSLPVMI